MSKRYDFVAAAPKDLCTWLVNGAPHTTAEEKRVVEKLLTKPDMHGAWLKLNKLGYKFLKSTEIGPLAFLVEVLKIWHSWTKVPKMTVAQLTQEIDEIAEAASALSERLKAHQADLVMTDLLEQFDLELVRDGVESSNFDVPMLSEVLTKYAQLLNQHRSRFGASSLSQPKSATERNRLFCLNLCRYFKTNYGKPLYPVVAEFHNAVFDNRQFDAKGVEQLVAAKEVKKNKNRKTSGK